MDSDLTSPPTTPLLPHNSIAKRGNGKTVCSAPPFNMQQQRQSHSQFSRDHDGTEEEEDLLTEEDLSIENYMRRHPCVLDRGSAFLDRHSWIYQAIVVLVTLGGVVTGTLAAQTLQFTNLHFSLAYLAILTDFILFLIASRRSPGRTPNCPDETSVIQLIHSWPVSSHHYGLHASEWSRSWSYCEPCHSWRPARAHHCSRCRQCVPLMDHHCIWVGQCVGANNLRYFFAYVSLTMMLSIYGLIISYLYITHTPAEILNESVSMGTDSLLIFISLLIFALCGTTASGWLVLRCFYMLFQNETGIEGLKKLDYKKKQHQAQLVQQHGHQGSQMILTKEKMLKDPGNGSAPLNHQRDHLTTATSDAKRSASDPSLFQLAEDDLHDSAENGFLASLNHAASSPASSDSNNHPRFFSPFQCACHSESFRVLYCQKFNYPSLQSSHMSIPPLPFYYDYNSNDWTMNVYLFIEDMKRMERLFQWILNGSKPAQPIGKHMQLKPISLDGSAPSTTSANTRTTD